MSWTQTDTDMGYSITSYSLDEEHPKVKLALSRAVEGNGGHANGGDENVA